MPYVQRNTQSEIIGLLRQPSDSANEFLVASHPDVVAFLSDAAQGQESLFSPQTDLEMVRIIEDLIELLISKNVIVLTDLPMAVQKKLLLQQNRRGRFFRGVSVDEDGVKDLF